ncbi:MAG: anion transporter [Candidatus Rokuibacteriota bacterium]|nr:MAG: anion transporter [Candidatus Rokubacteria bacterium]
MAIERVIALVAFAGTYLGLALGRLPVFRVDRTGVAIIGAAIVVVTGVLPWDQAVASVDAHTLVLLFGMMIVGAYLRLSGFFHLVTHVAVRRAHTPVGLLGLIIVAAGVLSALFVNDVVCLVMAPIVLDLVRRFRLPPVPYLTALATGYRTFLTREAPVAVVGLALVFLVIWLVYRRVLPSTLPAANLQERFTVHYPLMIKTMIAVAVMLVAFLTGVPIAVVAIGGAAYCLLTRRVNPAKVYREIDWGLLVVFTGLFVVVGGIEVTGLTGELLGWVSAIGLYRPAALTAVTAALSNLVSNVPAVLLIKTVIPTFGEPTRAWLILAMASTLAGNLTILGSVANLIVVEQARGAGIEVRFVEYSKVGVPVTLLTLLMGWLLLIL